MPIAFDNNISLKKALATKANVQCDTTLVYYLHRLGLAIRKIIIITV